MNAEKHNCRKGKKTRPAMNAEKEKNKARNECRETQLRKRKNTRPGMNAEKHNCIKKKTA
jgi:hypothetical protein